MSTEEQELDVIVVGAGFGGCHLLHNLRKNGFSVKVLEAGRTLGGVWCWNVSVFGVIRGAYFHSTNFDVIEISRSKS